MCRCELTLQSILLTCFILHLFLVVREESERLHELVALGDGNVRIVETPCAGAVYVEPPVAFQNGLIEECGFRAEERLHHQAVVGESADVKHLELEIVRLIFININDCHLFEMRRPDS